jgi:hypothetical protein
MSSAGYFLRAHFLQQSIAQKLPPHCTEALERALKGEDGCKLIFSAPNELRGPIAAWLYFRYRAGETPQLIFRQALDAAWSLDHAIVRGTINDRRVLQSMFRHAGFPKPKGAWAKSEIWRGTSGISLRVARRGISWTTKRELACWFATCFFRARPHKPLVMKAIVATADLIFPSNDRSEFEAIYFDGHAAEIDGTEEEWRLNGQRWENSLKNQLL